MATTHDLLQPLHTSVLELIEQFRSLVAWRHARERELQRQARESQEALAREQRQRTRNIVRRVDAAIEQLRQRDAELRGKVAEIERRYHAQFKELKQLLKARYRQFHRAVEQARKSYRDAAWESTTIHEATKTGVRADLETYGSQLEVLGRRAAAVREHAMRIAADWSIPQLDVPEHGRPPAETAAKLRSDLTAAQDQADDLLQRAGSWPRLGTAGWLALAIGASVAVAVTVAVGVTVRWLPALLGFPLVLVLLAGLAYLVHWVVQRNRVRRLLCEAVSLAAWVERNLIACRRMMELEGQERIRRDAERHRSELNRLRARLREELLAARDRYRAEGRRIRDGELLDLRRIQSELLTARQEVDGFLERRLAELRRGRSRELLAAKAWYRDQQQRRRLLAEQARRDLAAEFARKLHSLRNDTAKLWQACRERFPVWHRFVPERWQPAEEPAEYVFIGQMDYDLIEHAGAREGWFADRADACFCLPALVPLPPSGALMLDVPPQRHRDAVGWQRNFIARYLQAVPPGRFRLLLLDPAFLGDPFSGLMHLADYDRSVVSGRIWSEPRAIDQQLERLQEQLETVIQAFLRDRFATLREYNRSAGEVAEPYRLVVLTDCPDSLPESALHRLHAIATNATRCGVTLLLLRPARSSPLGAVEEEVLGPVSLSGQLDYPQLRFDEVAGERLPPVELEAAPPSELFTRLVHRVGALVAEAGRVEVPFERILPEPAQWWQASTRDGLAVPLGVIGAQAVQELQLGRGTAQHVLVAGRTGSGKSNLLHVLITSAALKYSPNELLLYLVDFKKGVEFKAYASYELPHARVVAIESEREFGLSVLQQLDHELQRRGELFRAAGVQDLPSYRRARPNEPMPRILLIVDEFQEFFVEDDQIAQQASLLLDRLVRQGRAFGMHVLLGSQTLGGAYSLARSTVSQMGVRIALQCSEGDAHLILSEDNPAARLLSRPGEAIYNDANGLVEGNRRFQIAWLPAPVRDRYLAEVRRLAEQAQWHRDVPMLVFEGNVPADLARNDELSDLLARPWQPDAPQQALQLWLGESVALPRPVAAMLEPRAGSNLLLVGQDAVGAAGILVSSLLSAAAQRPPAGSDGLRIYIADEAAPERCHRQLWRQLAEFLPHQVELLGSGRAVEELVLRLADELDRHESDGAVTLVVLYDIARIRALRAADELFSFTDTGGQDGADVSRRFRKLYEEGPERNVHLLVWCDTAAGAQRVFGRSGVREFGLRVVFQMSANDSTTLIDSPAAARLGVYRALFYDEDRGTLEKFRPYAVPELVQLKELARRIAARFAAER